MSKSISQFQVGIYYPNITSDQVTGLKTSGRKVIVVFHWKNCGHCVRYTPILKELAKKFANDGGGVIVVGIESENIPEKWAITSFPTTWFFGFNGRSKKYDGPRTVNDLYNSWQL